jgi:hypothetical protein
MMQPQVCVFEVFGWIRHSPTCFAVVVTLERHGQSVVKSGIWHLLCACFAYKLLVAEVVHRQGQSQGLVLPETQPTAAEQKNNPSVVAPPTPSPEPVPKLRKPADAPVPAPAQELAPAEGTTSEGLPPYTVPEGMCAMFRKAQY